MSLPFEEPLLPLDDPLPLEHPALEGLPELDPQRIATHPGVGSVIAAYYAEAIAVCVRRHHDQPFVEWSVREDQHSEVRYALRCGEAPANNRGFANHDDATRDAAYGVALASADVHLGLIALRRTEGRSGADYYLIPTNSGFDSDDSLDLDRDDLLRLEVSGIDRDDEAGLWRRLRAKVAQTVRGASETPALSCVVGFKSGSTLFSTPVER